VGVQNIKGITASVVNTNNIQNYYDKPQIDDLKEKPETSEEHELKVLEEKLDSFFETELRRKNLSLPDKYLE
jgi:hypothetical protein